MKTIKTKSGKIYTKKLICEAIAYWNKLLNLRTPIGLDESIDKYLTIGDLTDIISKHANLKSFKIKGYVGSKVICDDVVGLFGYGNFEYGDTTIDVTMDKSKDLATAAENTFYNPSIKHFLQRLSSHIKHDILVLRLSYGETAFSKDLIGNFFVTAATMQNDTLVLLLVKASSSLIAYLAKKNCDYADYLNRDVAAGLDLKLKRYLEYPLAIYSSIDDVFWWGALSKHKDDATIKKAIEACTDKHDDEYRQVYVDPVSKLVVSRKNLDYDYIVKMLKNKGKITIPCATLDSADEEYHSLQADDCNGTWTIRFATKDDIEELIHDDNAFDIIK